MSLPLALFATTVLFQTSEPFLYPSMLPGLNWPSSLFGGSYGLGGSSGLPWADSYHGTLSGSGWNGLSGGLFGQPSPGGLFPGSNTLFPGGQFSNGLFSGGAYGQSPLSGQLGGGLLPNGLLQPNAGAVCPPGWTLYAARGKCFIAISSGAMKGWVDHTLACQALMPGATLASIHDANEQNFVADVARAKGGSDAWIGMSDLGSGVWRWTDNSPVEYAFWELGQPDKYLGIQHCVRMQLNKYGAWDDLNCDNSAIWTSVCQIYTQNSQPLQG
ncbi:C-type lectin protein [Aphelenchoides avenae]|nr:C-type lectin protein [Aphelenchus avenae]